MSFENQMLEIPQNQLQQEIAQSLILDGQKKQNQLIINSVDFNDKFLLVATATGLFTYSIKSNSFMQKNILIDKQDVWEAVFIPKTHYVAYVLNNNIKRQHSRDQLHIFNIKQKKIAANMQITEQIEYIKPSKGCIGLGSLSNIYILHFPSLKPIYAGPAGNGIRITFDISYQGLTMAHDSAKKGQLRIHNFTNISTQRLLSQRKKSYYSKSKSLIGEKRWSQTTQQLIDEIQPLLVIKAHKQNICQIKISPNGSKTITASNKGTLLRIFNNRNGQKLQEFRIGFQIVRISYLGFVKQGSFLGCLTEKGAVFLFNVAMDPYQKQLQTQRKGHQLYCQQNPKSNFAFLSFLFPALGDSYPFNNYQLINPEHKQSKELSDQLVKQKAQEMSKKSSELVDLTEKSLKSVQLSEKKSFQQDTITIEQLDEQQHEQGMIYKQEDIIRTSSLNQINLAVQIPSRKRQSLNISQRPKPHISLRPSSLINPLIQSQPSYRPFSASPSRLSQIRRNSYLHKKPIQKFNRSYYNMIGKLYIMESNYVWVVKGYHLWGLKYDPFHGGEIQRDRVAKIF